MDKNNQTVVTEFLLLGFGNLHNLRIFIFIFFLIIHILALSANVLVIVLVAFNKSLHSPMYFFLSQLSLSEIMFTSNIVPNMLWLILAGGGKVSITRCILQFYFLGVPTVVQCLVLAAMSFDRHVAICRPLHYVIIMTFKRQLQIVTVCWLVGLSLSFVIYIFLNKLKFCDLHVINHFFCDTAPLMQLSCIETSSMELAIAVIAYPVVLGPFMFIVATYISILQAILKISSTSGRQKAFSTCSSHLTIVCMYFGTLSSIYIVPPRENSIDANKGISLLYTLVTPLLNPLIYSLRSKDIRSAFFKTVNTLKQWNPF